MVTAPMQSLGKLGADDVARRERATIFLRAMCPERKFGYWRWLKQPGLPMPEANRANERTEKHFEVLKEIEAYAGYIVIERYSHALCRICVQTSRSNHGISDRDEREFVFRASPDAAYLYRWPGVLSHYYDRHKIEAPEWLPLLVQEFQAAKAKGLWK